MRTRQSWDAPQFVEHHGVMVEGNRIVAYDTRHPAPTQWTAVGIVSKAQTAGTDRGSPRLVVGTGPTELAARDDLRRRVIGTVSRGEEDEFVVDWAPMDVDTPESPW